jgi:hypothetical protein
MGTPVKSCPESCRNSAGGLPQHVKPPTRFGILDLQLKYKLSLSCHRFASEEALQGGDMCHIAGFELALNCHMAKCVLLRRRVAQATRCSDSARSLECVLGHRAQGNYSVLGKQEGGFLYQYAEAGVFDGSECRLRSKTTN